MWWLRDSNPLTALKNAIYFLPEMIQVMTDHVKHLFHKMLKICNLSFYIDETKDITLTEQFAVYATLCLNNLLIIRSFH